MNKIIKTSSVEEKTSAIEKSLRPFSLEEYIGQEKIKEQVKYSIISAKKRETSLDHILLFGPPGLGKTTLAYIIASEMSQNIRYIAGPSLEKPGDIVSVLTQMEDNDLLFIDEIHRMNHMAEEVLYSAMEDFFVNITIGREGQNKQVKMSLPHFTLIGATTKPGMLSAPLRDRFGLVCRMEYYTEEELCAVAERTARLMGISLNKKGILTIAKCSRGTPRITNRNMGRIRDFAVANDLTDIKATDIVKALEVYGICNNGLNDTDVRILSILKEKDSPVGLETLAALTGEDSGTIENVYEPYLLMEGYIEKTAKGRVITSKGCKSIIT